ncbi:MAG TPA: LTA synthase family protein, partial [Dokdonella sp.]|nr:LTA synthase family protein [Dokdonella sp.]
RRATATCGHRLGIAGITGVVLLLMLVPWARALVVERTYGGFADCGSCVRWQSLGNDAWLAGAGILVLALGLLLRWRILRHVCAFAVFALGLVMLVDTLLLDLFTLRLHMGDVLKFGGEGRATTQFIQSLAAGGYRPLPYLAVAIPGIFVLLWFPLPRTPRLARALLGSGIAMIACGVWLAATARDHVFRDSAVNIVQLSGMRGINQPYSEAFKLRMLAQERPQAVLCDMGQERHPDVLLLMVESLSAHHSALLGGSGFTPQLDAIARANTWFEAFHANGFTTDHGLIALMDGRVPVPAVGRYLSLYPFTGFGDPEHSVGGVLGAHGYQTAFFTSGNLGFLEKQPWLKSLHLSHFEGAESPFYEGKPRGIFDAATDEVLYQRVIQWLDNERDRTRPLFAAVLTVETHPPFLDRASGKLDEAALFRRADAAIGDFYRTLQARGFFDNGILLIVGDHRSMTTVTREEWERYGDSALARVPMVVVGPSGLPKGAIAGAFQQVDLLPSLAQLTGSGPVCRREDQGSFLRPDPQPPAWVLHPRGDLRGRVDVYFPDGTGWIDLAGDASVTGGAHPERMAAIANAVHRDRIERGEVAQDMAELLMKISVQRLEQEEQAR